MFPLLSCSLSFSLSLSPLVERWRGGGGGGGGGVCWHSCTVCSALDRALAPIHIPSLPPLAPLPPAPPPPLNTLPPPPTQPLQLSLVASLTTATACNSTVLFKTHPPPYPFSLTITFLNPSSHISPNSVHAPRLPRPPPPSPPLSLSQPVAAGPASVTQMHTVALGARHGNKALAGLSGSVCCSVFQGVCVRAHVQICAPERAEIVRTARHRIRLCEFYSGLMITSRNKVW